MATEGDPFLYAHQHADEVVWMSQNTNHLPTDPAIQRAMEEAIEAREYNGYPYKRGIAGLEAAILRDLDLPARGWHAHITAGGLEGLYCMNRALLAPGDEVVASDPSFLPIHHQIRLSGATPVEVPVYEDPWRLTPEKVAEAITDRTRMILLIDPLNPLGSAYPRDAVRGIAELAVDHDLVLVHDVTYRDFAFEHAPAQEFAPERTLLAYSLSKNAGFAGLRIGALVGPQALMDEIEPYQMNVLGTDVVAQRAAEAALATKDRWIGSVVETARANQARIKAMVDGMEDVLLPVYPSSSNQFVLDVSATGVDPDEVMRRLLYDHHVFVRGGPYLSDRFGHRFVRVSFTVPPEGVARFCRFFPEVLRDLAKRA